MPEGSPSRTLFVDALALCKVPLLATRGSQLNQPKGQIGFKQGVSKGSGTCVCALLDSAGESSQGGLSSPITEAVSVFGSVLADSGEPSFHPLP